MYQWCQDRIVVCPAPATPQPADAIQMAMELGRLDLVSVLLTAIGLLAIFGGLFAFGYLRGIAAAVAKETAEREVEKRLTTLLQSVAEQTQRGLEQPEAEKRTEAKTTGVEEAAPEGEFGDDNGAKK